MLLSLSLSPPHEQDLASDNVVQLMKFKETYKGMGASNGDRAMAARKLVPEGTEVISMGGGMPEHALLPFDELVHSSRRGTAGHPVHHRARYRCT